MTNCAEKAVAYFTVVVSQLGRGMAKNGKENINMHGKRMFSMQHSLCAVNLCAVSLWCSTVSCAAHSLCSALSVQCTP
jgi:hypothetical protein